MNRREFVAANLLSSIAFPEKTMAAPSPIPVIDTHQHLWDLERFELSWLDKSTPSGAILGHSFTPKDYALATAGINVVKAVYMEVDVIPAQQQQEADYLIELCASEKTQTRAAVVSGRPASEGFAKYIKQFQGNEFIKGIRQVLHVKETTPKYYLDSKYVAGLQLLGELGLSFDLCVHSHELTEHAKLIDLCPNTRFILDHCGNADLKHTPAQRDKWKLDMAAIANRKNIVGKVSGFIASAPARGKWTLDDLAPVINHTLDVFGPDRVMFGGDWPVCLLGVEKYGDWFTALSTIVQDRSLVDQKKLFHDNAAKFYGL